MTLNEFVGFLIRFLTSTSTIPLGEDVIPGRPARPGAGILFRSARMLSSSPQLFMGFNSLGDDNIPQKQRKMGGFKKDFD